MNLFVLRQVVVANKRFPTLVAFVPLVIVMDSQVKSTGEQSSRAREAVTPKEQQG